MTDRLAPDIEAQIDQLGYELVDLERAGSRTRPVLRIRIDRPEGGTGGIDLEDCSRVSRALESYLENRGDVPERYVLEVSSPGVERPLVKDRDFERFKGERVAVHGRVPLPTGGKRVEGELLGLSGSGRVAVRTDDGAELTIERENIKRIHLVYRWGGEGRDA